MRVNWPMPSGFWQIIANWLKSTARSRRQLLLKNLLSQTLSANSRAFSLDLISKSKPDEDNLDSANIREKQPTRLNRLAIPPVPYFCSGDFGPVPQFAVHFALLGACP